MTTHSAGDTPTWYDNLLYEENYFKSLLNKTDDTAAPALLAWLQTHYDAAAFTKMVEADLEHAFIRPVLEHLGWVMQPQIQLGVQGANTKPDWGLFLDDAAKTTFNVNKDDHLHKALEQLQVLLEAKRYGVALDKSANKKDLSPHFQLMAYLSDARKRYGFLTDGRYWRFYDVEKISRTKSYIQIDLEAVLALADLGEQARALALFVTLFGQASYVPSKTGTAIVQLSLAAETYASEAEEDLRSVIYGTNGRESLFEGIGKHIHSRAPEASLTEVYDAAIVLLFRLLFLVYFEDKNQALLSRHPHYKKVSLGALYDTLAQALDASQNDKRLAAAFDGNYALRQLFVILDKGAEEIDIPLFNGGLFNPDRAPLLNLRKLFNNKTLHAIIRGLLYKTPQDESLWKDRRDYKNMSVTHLGRIYEGLLEYTFDIAPKDMVYVTYTLGKESPVEAYLDKVDLAVLKKEKGYQEAFSHTVKAGECYLKNNNNSRKSSASYYTPSSLSFFLVKSAIDTALTPPEGTPAKPLQDLKIIDNACGSGHFLVEALNYLTLKGIETLGESPALAALLAEERQKIEDQLTSLNVTDYAVEDAQILKRLLLKRCIFGVDLNLFAVELARLSLWMDTFIFGTPLSFIEHHVQHGNALMGASEAEFNELRQNYFENTAQTSLSFGPLAADFTALESTAKQLNTLQDTTTAEVERSKAIYKNEVEPMLNKIADKLSFISYLKIKTAEAIIDKNKTWGQQKALDLTTFFEKEGDEEYATLMADVRRYAARHHFFHYDIFFPEARAGFDMMVGNPPWDKTKFTDMDFFPRFHSRYRSLSNSEKQAVQNQAFEDAANLADYETRARNTKIVNEYYKTAFPLNAGSGDGNLFRFFVEKNLGLLADKGSLNYVLPSALMFEEGSETLRKAILTSTQLRYFYSFENREALFPEVDSRYKFAMMQIVNTAPVDAAIIDTAFYLTQPEQITPERQIPYTLAQLKTLSPNQWAMMELRKAADLALLSRAYAAFKPLSPAWLDFRRELDMTNDKDLFLEKPKVEALAANLIPLFEGKMMWQFNHQLTEPTYWLNPDDLRERLTSKEFYRMVQQTGIKREICEEKHADALTFDQAYYRLGFRAVASDTNERTLIVALLPKNVGVGNSLYSSIPKNYVLTEDKTIDVETFSPLQLLFSVAWLNSLALDWIARFMIQINVNKTYLMRLPMPQPTDEELLANADYVTLAKNALLLTMFDEKESGHTDFDDLWNDVSETLKVGRNDIPKTPKAADALRFDNDQIVARLYGFSPDDLRYILESFDVMRKKRPEYAVRFE